MKDARADVTTPKLLRYYNPDVHAACYLYYRAEDIAIARDMPAADGFNTKVSAPPDR